MAVTVSGNRGLNFIAGFDISEVEENSKRVLSLFDNVKKQAATAGKVSTVDTSYRKEQLAIQKALADSRLAVQRLKEEQQAQRNEQEKSRTVIAAERAELEKLKSVEAELNQQYKKGKIALQEYLLEQKKIADAERAATQAKREAERTLKAQEKLQREAAVQAERNRKLLEKESSEYYKLTQALGKVRTEAKDVQAEMFRLEREGLKASDAYRQLEIRSKALTAQTGILDNGVKRIDASLGLHQRNVGNYGQAVSQLSPQFAAINNQLGLFGTSLDALAVTKDPFKTLATSMLQFGKAAIAFMLTPVGAIITALAGLYALISANKQTVVDFDAGLRGVQKTTNMLDEELYAFGDSIIALSNNLKSVSTKELLEFAQVAGQLGVKGADNILRFSETLAKLQTASDISGEEGATEIARLLTLTDGGVENVSAFGDEIVNLGNNMAATERQILANAESISQNTGLYKMGRQQVLAYAAATKATGLEAEVVGSSFSRSLGLMESAVRNNSKSLNTFAALTGRSAESFKKAFKDDAAGTFTEFVRGLNEVSKSGGSVQGILEQVGVNAVRDQRVIATLATNGYGELDKALKLVGQSAGAMDKEFDTANRKLENVGKRIGIAWDNLVLSIENGQGVFAKMGTYLGNELADGLVTAKKAIDDLGVAFTVSKQYFDDYFPSVEKAGTANMQFASTFSSLQEVFDKMTIRGWIQYFEVDIPSGFREAGAHVEAFVNRITQFARFLSTAGPEISKYIKDALNPFAEANSGNIDKLYDNFKRKIKAQNDFIINDTKRVNDEALRLFNERYDAAANAVAAGEQAIVDAAKKGVNGALAAAIEAEMAEQEAVSAASKNKANAANEAAKKAEAAAKRAAQEAAAASEEAKAEADAAADRAAKAAAHAREVASQAQQIMKERIAAQRAMQAKIDELNASARRKELSQNEAEIQAVEDKYKKIQSEIDAFYKDTKNAGLKVNTSGLADSKQKEIANLRAKQEVEAAKGTIAEQKQLYDQFEQYKAEYGKQKARERFAGEISEFETYVAYLKSLMPDASDMSVKAVRMREMLEKELDKAEKTARDKSFDENLKNFKRVIAATADSNSERLRIEEQYQEDLATLKANLTGEQNADELAQRKAALDTRKEMELEQLKEKAFQETDFYKKVMKDITYMTRDEIKARVKEIRKILKDPNLSPVERATAKQSLGTATSYLAGTSKTVDNAEELQKYASMASQSFSEMASAVQGMNPELSKVLSTMGEVAGIAANAAGAFAGFASGNIVQGVQGAMGAAIGIIKMIDQSEQKRQLAEEKRQLVAEKTNRDIAEMNRLLDRQAQILDRALGEDRLDAFRRHLQLIQGDILDTIKKLEDLNLTLSYDRGNGRLGNKPYNIDLSSLNEVLQQVSGRPDRRGSSSPQDPAVVLKTIDDVLKANREQIEKIYKELAAGTLSGDIEPLKDLLTTYEQLEQQMEEYKQRLKEELTGINFSSLTDEIVSMFREGKTAAADLADSFQKLMENAIMQTFKRKAIEKQMQQFYDSFALAAEDGLTKEEIDGLRNDYLAKMAQAKEEFEALNQIAGTNIGAQAAEDAGANQNTLSGAIRASLTEETGGKLAGIMQGQFGLTKQQLVKLEGIAGSLDACYSVATQSANSLVRIDYNTRMGYESGHRVEGKLDNMGDALKTIARNTSGNGGASARDLGLDG